MKQFGTILRFEYLGYLKNKIFVGITVFLVAVIAVVMCFPRIAQAFDRDDQEPGAPGTEARPVLLVGAEEEAMAQTVAASFAEAFPDYEVRAEQKPAEDIRDLVRNGEAECAFVLQNWTTYTYYVENLSMYDTNTSVANEILKSVYQMQAMMQGGFSPEDAASVLQVQISSEVETLGVDQAQNFLYTYIMVFALYMVILLYGQMVATNVATEKSSRAMEVLITSAKPTSMMFGKVLASCLAGLTQLAIVFGSALVLYQLNASYWKDNFMIASIFGMPASLFLYMLLFFALGFLIYAFLYGAVGSTASKLEDINTSVMPITVLFIIGFFVVVFSMSSGSVDNLLMRICSYIPFTSPMAMFTRIAMSVVPAWEIALSVLILAASAVGVGVLAAKIYRVGVLLYGTTPKIGSILKAIRKA